MPVRQSLFAASNFNLRSALCCTGNSDHPASPVDAEFLAAPGIKAKLASGKPLDIYVSYHDVSNEFAPSLGSGPRADVMFLFTSDICGQSERRPRHARAWGDLAAKLEAVRRERVSALAQFRAAVADQSFPAPAECADAAPAEIDAFRAKLETSGG